LIFVAGEAGAQLHAGTRAPEVELSTLQGANFKLSALRGHPVVLTFWGTWCPPCKEEFPALGELYRQQHSSGLEVVGVNQRDQEVSTADVQKFITDFATPFPIVLDARGRSRRAYRLIGLPTTVFIDTAGVVAHVVSGPVSAELLETGLRAIGVRRP
jgi:peroxiredoxin